MTPFELHRCLAHVSLKAAKELIEAGWATGIELLKGDDNDTCEVCVRSKITRKVIPGEAHPAVHDMEITKYGEKLHSDTWDADTTSLGGNTKSALFVDEHTRMHHGYPIKSITETTAAYKNLEAAILTQTGTQVCWLHRDNGNEYITLKPYVESRGTHWSASVPCTPEQNGIAERAHCVHRERVSAMLLDSGLPRTLWAHAYKYSIYTHNCTGHTALSSKTPYKAHFGTVPDLQHLRPWGARVWVRPEKTRKLEPRGIPGFFVRLSENHQDGIHVYWPEKHNITVVRSFVWAASDRCDADVPSEGARIEQIESEDEFTDSDSDARDTADAPAQQDNTPRSEGTGDKKGTGAEQSDGLEGEGEEA